MKDIIVNSKEFRKELGNISNSTLWRRIKDGSIPEPLKIGGGRSNYFKLSWVDSIIEKQSEVFQGSEK